MSAAGNFQIAFPQGPIVNGNGMMSLEWQRFFLWMYNRSGGAQGVDAAYVSQVAQEATSAASAAAQAASAAQSAASAAMSAAEAAQAAADTANATAQSVGTQATAAQQAASQAAQAAASASGAASTAQASATKAQSTATDAQTLIMATLAQAGSLNARIQAEAKTASAASDDVLKIALLTSSA